MMLLKKIGVGKIMTIFKLFQYLNITIGNLLTKILKYSVLAIVLLIIIGFATGITPMDAIRYMTKIIMKQEGLRMHTTKWEEYDFTEMEGEEQIVVYGSLAKALVNYRIYTFYPFDGDAGFIAGSDYDKQNRIYNNSLNAGDEVDTYGSNKEESAYLFKTDNDGKTFTKQALGNGFVAEIIKYKEYYYAIVEDYLWSAKTFISRDKGKSWSLHYPASIEAFFDNNHFIFSEPTGIQTVQSVLRFKYFYTKDGGKTSTPLSDKIMNYAKNMHPVYQRNFRLIFNIYNGKLLFIDGNSLISVNIDTQKEERIELKIPKGYKLASYASREYGENLLEGHKTRDRNLNTLQINKENGKPYILLQKDDTDDKTPQQISIWYPFEDKHIIFDKKISKIVPLKVSGDYVGGFVKKNSILTHVWSLNNGKSWDYEFLTDYHLLVGPKVMYNKVWMTALVRGERPDRERPDDNESYLKIKGSYLVIGKLKETHTK